MNLNVKLEAGSTPEQDRYMQTVIRVPSIRS